MSNPKQNPKTTVPALNTLPDFYKHYYSVLFDKLEKEKQEELTANLSKPNRIIRGEPTEYSNVRVFVKSVIEKAEEEYDKAVAKKVINETHTDSKAAKGK